MKSEGLLVPMGLGLSPTMRCNLSCTGCYARLHPKSEEMSLETIDTFFRDATALGVYFFVITGGEPYIRGDMLDIYEKYPGALFLTVTNGTLIDDETADRIALLGNIMPVISVEGEDEHTDARRGNGVHTKVLECMDRFRERKILFGFSSVVTNETAEILGSEDFISNMIEKGCTLGFYNDFIPIESEDFASVPSTEQIAVFKCAVAEFRKTKPIVLVHLPHDEYDRHGRCTAVASGSVHINAQGDVEPCPFSHYAKENIKRDSFRDVLSSPFMRAIREHPTALQHGDIGCSLVNNHDILVSIAEKTGAESTNITVEDPVTI
jgi:MoaA/NifB/PqqE/SkfB family radical SAM enzyme